MINILDLNEAKEWAEKNLFEADSFLFPLNVAVKNGLLLNIDDEHFAVKEVETKFCTWVVDSITRLSDEEMKKAELYHRYRYKAHAENCVPGYEGIREIDCGIL